MVHFYQPIKPNQMNNIVPCNFSAVHPAAMAAAQLILWNGLTPSDMALAMKKWKMIQKEIEEGGEAAM